uniref:Uncharacterized protein n=2 Tax=Attheya septentrionalis TaxID=420275 RepID=A0A7S2UC44_9STRA|mmetsp:Transcript_18586/g.33684  ORF Transcript_18586/g.33684 Transcript_18586/m.33684 type:complete len:154 (+) Transcript_18586:1059-1520(+)
MYPQLFRKDLLSHEAHRHPFIERLGVMYMLKLRHGEHFARTSGSCWRLLFVFALMPWMRKYRILNNDDVDESNFKFSSFRQFPSRPLKRIPPKRKSTGATEEFCDEENGDNLGDRVMQLSKGNELLRKENDILRDENEALKAQMIQTCNNGYN